MKICISCGKQKPLDDFHQKKAAKSLAIRGVICEKCNQGLGLFQDRPELLRRAAEYLESPR